MISFSNGKRNCKPSKLKKDDSRKGKPADEKQWLPTVLVTGFLTLTHSVPEAVLESSHQESDSSPRLASYKAIVIFTI